MNGIAEDEPDETMEPNDGWWCAECHGLGGWEESGEEVDFGDAEDVECPCCGGNGVHYHGPGPCTGGK